MPAPDAGFGVIGHSLLPRVSGATCKEEIMSMKMKHWQDPISLLAGLWLATSPWLFAYQMETRSMWNAVVAGVLIAVIAFYALFRVFAWQQWANLVVGVWLIV